MEFTTEGLPVHVHTAIIRTAATAESGIWGASDVLGGLWDPAAVTELDPEETSAASVHCISGRGSVAVALDASGSMPPSDHVPEIVVVVIALCTATGHPDDEKCEVVNMPARGTKWRARSPFAPPYQLGFPVPLRISSGGASSYP